MVVAERIFKLILFPLDVFRSLHNDALLEERTVERERFVFASLAAHIHAVLVVHLHQVSLHVFYRLSQVTLWREAE